MLLLIIKLQWQAIKIEKLFFTDKITDCKFMNWLIVELTLNNIIFYKQFKSNNIKHKSNWKMEQNINS